MSSLAVVERVLKEEGEALLFASNQLKENSAIQAEVQNVLDLLNSTLKQGGRIAVSGVGKSGKIADKIASTLNSLGLPALFLHSTEALHGDLGAIRPIDTVWAISQSGRSSELLTLASHLAERKISWIAMTGDRNSPLADGAAGLIFTGITQEACTLNIAPTTSTTLALAWGDSIAVALMTQRGTALEAFRANHPGGSLGKRLSLRVQSLMTQQAHTPTLGPNESFQTIVQSLNASRLGGVLVVEGALLLGVITEGDIRRALLQGPDCFQKCANQLMTSHPVLSYPEQLAWEALQLMENRPHALSLLPVVEKDTRRWCGILRLHDLLQEL